MQTAVLDSPQDLQKLFDGIGVQASAVDWTGELRGELDYIADLHKSFFDRSMGPDGAPWKPNAPSTIEHKGHAVILRGVRGRRERDIKVTARRPGVRFRKTRNIRGYRLATSLTAKTSQSFGDAVREAVATQNGGSLTFGTAVEYSVYNDQGTGRIPARPHVGLTEKYLDQATGRAADHLLEQLKK